MNRILASVSFQFRLILKILWENPENVFGWNNLVLFLFKIESQVFRDSEWKGIKIKILTI
jgi:hypothetical protein